MTKNWLQVKSRIRELYVVQGKSLTEVGRQLRDKEGFTASTRAYRLKLHEWGFKRARGSVPRSTPTDEQPPISIAERNRERAHIPSPRGNRSGSEVSDYLAVDILDCIYNANATSLQTLLTWPCQSITSDGSIDFSPEFSKRSHFQHVIGRSLLSLAASCSSLEVVKLLLQEGMDVNLKDPQTRYTPLMIAIMREEVSIVNCLLENGASMALINAGRHALHVAASARNPKILELLISHGAPLDAPAADGPDKGSTALDIALIRRAKHFGTQDHPVTINMLRCLLRAGAQFKGSEYLIIKPWMESPQRGSRFDQEDLELFLEFVRAGLDLKMEIDNLPDKRHTNPVTIEHAVVFHSSWSGVGSFLAQNLSIVPERRNQHHLIHTLCAGCFYNYSTRVEEDVNEAIETLLKRGLDPDLMDDTEYSPLNFLLDTVAWFNVDHPKRLGSLRTLLMHRANPCSGDGAVYPVRQVLEGPDYIAVDNSYVFDVIRLLLEYFSYSNMPYAPLWQREYLAEHLPITSNYKAYREGEYFEAMLIRHSGLQQSSVTIFRRAALAVSMRKFLEAQLSLGVSQRNYEDILEALTLQRDQKLPGEAMPRYFVIDVLSLLSQTSNRQFPLHQPFTESWDISAKSKGERTAGHIGHKEMISSHFRLP